MMQSQEQRQKMILTKLSLNGRIYNQEIAKLAGVSIETIRRDIKQLHDEGVLKKTHGGAIKLKTNFIAQNAFSVRMTDKTQEKNAIGMTALQLINEGNSIFIDGGSTTCALASCLTNFTQLTIITNSTLIAQTIYKSNPRLHIYLIGGQYSGANEQNIGPAVVSQINEFSADLAFIGANGISVNEGITISHLEELEIASAMLKNAKTSIVLADKSKLNHVALCKLAPLTDFDYLISNDLSTIELKHFEEQGLHILNAISTSS